MTRDEAIDLEIKSARAWEPFARIPDLVIREAAGHTIDNYVALGMLKLDKPNDSVTSMGLLLRGLGPVPHSQVVKLQNALDFLSPTATPLELKYWLEVSGLKITEK